MPDLHERRHEFDWLRVIAFFVLIYFHTAIIFVPGGLPLLQNADTSQVLDIFVQISSQFRLGLLFMVSGLGVAFASRRRDRRSFLLERSWRLLLPLVIGILLWVPPMVYLEKRSIGEFDGSLWAFYPTLFTDGVYPKGNLSWHHFWFLAYLYLYCLLGLAVYRQLDRARPMASWLSNGSRLFLLALPLWVIELLLRPWFPGFRDLIHDWASFSHWFVLFLAGYAFARHPSLQQAAIRLRAYSLLSALASLAILFGLYDGIRFDDAGAQTLSRAVSFAFFAALRIAFVWSVLLACFGYAGRYLHQPNKALSYLNQAVYPLFILHLTTSTAIGYVVVQWPLNLWLKFGLITTGTIVLVLLAYEVLIRRSPWLRPLFGLSLETGGRGIRRQL